MAQVSNRRLRHFKLGERFLHWRRLFLRQARAQARKVFAEPVHDRIFLAGKHVHQRYMVTAYGAYETGLDAAHKAAAALGFSVGPKDPLWLPS